MLPIPRRAVVYLQPGSVPQVRQARFCLEYCQQHDIEIVFVAPPTGIADAVSVVVDGDADLVVTAFASRARPLDLHSQALDAQVSVEYVRPPAVRREVADMLATMYRQSRGDVAGMAAMLGETTGELVAKLARLGIRRNRK